MSDSNTFDIEITAFSNGGAGIGRKDGKVILVSGALPTERVSIRVIEDKKRFARAETVKVDEPAEFRRELDCTHEREGGCGGCGLRHATHESALRLKTDAAMGEIRKVAPGLEWPKPELIPAESPDGYRQRARFQVDRAGQLGFFKRNSNDHVPIANCLSLSSRLNEISRWLSDCLRTLGHKSRPTRVLLEEADNGAFVSWSGPIKSYDEPELVDAVHQNVQVQGLVVRGRRVSVWAKERWIQQKAVISETEIVFWRQVGTFWQANEEINRALRKRVFDLVAEAARDCEELRVLDLFAGCGNLAVPARLAGASSVLAVEVVRDALAGLTRTVTENGLDGIQPYTRDLRKGLTKRLIAFAPQFVILDPPRIGAKEVMKALVQLRPRDIVYVACSPTHMARDVAMLEGHWRVKSVTSMDMFPRTPHVEMLVHLTSAGP